MDHERVTGSIEIHRPLEDAFDFVADQTNEPRYNEDMVRCEMVTLGPIGVGTRYEAQMKSTGAAFMRGRSDRIRTAPPAPVTRTSIVSWTSAGPDDHSDPRRHGDVVGVGYQAPRLHEGATMREVF